MWDGVFFDGVAFAMLFGLAECDIGVFEVGPSV